MDKLTEAQITEKLEVAMVRGASPKYPLTVSRASIGNTMEIVFEGTIYRVTVTEIGSQAEDDDDEE
jgi:hypothetical protein